MSEQSNSPPASLQKNSEMQQDGLAAILKQQVAIQKEDLKWKKRKSIATSIFFIFPTIAYVLWYAGLIGQNTIYGDYAALVRIDGEISDSTPASAAKIVPALRQAFRDKNAKGVVIAINSPGGSPVQSDVIHRAITDLRTEYPGKRVVVVAEDYMASGAYWIATAVPEIYVNNNTIAGSIGVKTTGFGLDVSKYKSWGIERRVVTAGTKKNRGDMFSPMQDEDLEKSQQIVEEIHKNFIAAVLETRQGKIKVPESVAFSGDYWTGNRAVQMGLADGISTIPEILHHELNVSTITDYTPQAHFFDSLRRGIGVDEVIQLFTSSTPKYSVM